MTFWTHMDPMHNALPPAALVPRGTTEIQYADHLLDIRALTGTSNQTSVTGLALPRHPLQLTSHHFRQDDAKARAGARANHHQPVLCTGDFLDKHLAQVSASSCAANIQLLQSLLHWLPGQVYSTYGFCDRSLLSSADVLHSTSSYVESSCNDFFLFNRLSAYIKSYLPIHAAIEWLHALLDIRPGTDMLTMVHLSEPTRLSGILLRLSTASFHSRSELRHLVPLCKDTVLTEHKCLRPPCDVIVAFC